MWLRLDRSAHLRGRGSYCKFTPNTHNAAGYIPEVDGSSGARQSLDGGERRVSGESEAEQLEPVLEQLATHVPDLIVFRSHDAPLPQTIHSYGVIMFGDISGKLYSPLYSL